MVTPVPLDQCELLTVTVLAGRRDMNSTIIHLRRALVSLRLVPDSPIELEQRLPPLSDFSSWVVMEEDDNTTITNSSSGAQKLTSQTPEAPIETVSWLLPLHLSRSAY
jgi:hypothetical protein